MFVVLLITLPILFTMLVWVLVTVHRIMSPEQPIPLEDDPVVQRIRQLEARVPVAVGSRDIKEMERRSRRSETTENPYVFFSGYSEGFPLEWLEDVERRRN